MSSSYSITELSLSGSPREIGRQHGEALRERVMDHIGMREDRLLAATGVSLAGFLDIVFEQTGFLEAVRQHAPDLLEEVEGIAEGSGMDFRRVFVAQLEDEAPWLKAHQGIDFSALDESHCSALGVAGWRAGAPLLGQNVDMGAFAQGWGVLLKLKPEVGPTLLTLTTPGVIGIYGLNAEGLGLCLNAMAARQTKSIHGMGTIFIARLLLACNDRVRAEAVLRKVPHASGEVYNLVDRSGLSCFEASPNQVVDCVAGGDTLMHTNHALVNCDLELTDERVAELPPAARGRLTDGARNSATRLAGLSAGLSGRPGRLSADDLKAVLSSHLSDQHPICRHDPGDGRPMSNFSLVMESGDKPVLHLADGPPCQHAYRKFSP